jgi:hypothetical protein
MRPTNLMYCFLALGLLSVVGCGGSTGPAPSATQDEFTAYAAENPAPPTVEVPAE